jgi:hypothetical protein
LFQMRSAFFSMYAVAGFIMSYDLFKNDFHRMCIKKFCSDRKANI